MATIYEIVDSIENDIRAAKARRANALDAQKKLLDSASNAGRTSLTDIERSEIEKFRNDADKASDALGRLSVKLERAKEILREEEKLDRLSQPNPSTRMSAASSGERTVNLNMYSVDMPSRSNSPVLAKGQRFNDHPVSRRVIEDNAARDRQIMSSHGSIDQQVRAITTGGADFSSIVPSVLVGEVIDLARNQSAVMRAGATVVPMSAKTVDIGRLTQDPSAEYVGTENTAFGASDPVFDSVQLVAKTMDAVVVGSMEFFQDVSNGEQVITEALAKAMALKLDEMALYGGNDGSTYGTQGVDYSNAKYPKGILYNTAINASDNLLGNETNGTYLTAASPYNEFLDCIYALRIVNEEANAAILNPLLAKSYAQQYDSTYQPLRQPEDVAQLPKFVTNQAATYDQGSGVDQSDLFVGDFRQLLLGIRQDVQIRVLRERYAEQNSIALVATMRMDLAVARDNGFAVYVALGGEAGS